MFLFSEDQMRRTGRVARGRQILDALWHDFTSGIYVTTVVTWQTLGSVSLHGNNLSDVSFRWYKVLAEVRVRPDVDSSTEMVAAQMRESSDLAQDIEYFDRVPVNHSDNTYEWLMVQIQKHIAKHKELS